MRVAADRGGINQLGFADDGRRLYIYSMSIKRMKDMNRVEQPGACEHDIKNQNAKSLRLKYVLTTRMFQSSQMIVSAI